MDRLKYSNEKQELNMINVFAWRDESGGIYSEMIQSFHVIKRGLYLEEFRKFCPISSDIYDMREILQKTVKRIDVFDWMLNQEVEIVAQKYSALFDCYFYLISRKSICFDIDNFMLKFWISKKELTDLYQIGFISLNKQNNVFRLLEIYEKE